MEDLSETIQLSTPAQDESDSPETATDQPDLPQDDDQWPEPTYNQDEDGEDDVADGVTANTLYQALGDFATNVPQPVNKYGMPSRQLSDLLFEEYWNNVHPGFPMINRPLFRAQYQSFWEDQGQQPGDKWLAILNVIFAIAAKYAHLTQAPWRGEENDHFLYFNRARLLSLTGEELFSPPNLQQVQLEGLVAFYLLATDQIGRYDLHPFSMCNNHHLTHFVLGPGEFLHWLQDPLSLSVSTEVSRPSCPPNFEKLDSDSGGVFTLLSKHWGLYRATSPQFQKTSTPRLCLYHSKKKSSRQILQHRPSFNTPGSERSGFRRLCQARRAGQATATPKIPNKIRNQETMHG